MNIKVSRGTRCKVMLSKIIQVYNLSAKMNIQWGFGTIGVSDFVVCDCDVCLD